MAIATGERMYASDINNLTFFPIGAILQFSGSQYTRLTSARTADNKAIWTLCDGTAVNGITVPNLVNKFLRGAANSGTESGADSRSVSIAAANLPSHSHGAGTLSVSGLGLSGMSVSGQTISGLTLDNAGAHSHTVSGSTGEGGSHNHTLSDGSAASNGGHTHTVTVHDSTHSKTPQHTDSTSDEYGEYHSATYTTSTVANHTHTLTGNTSSAGAHSHNTLSGTAAEGGSHSHTVNSSNATISGGTISGSITGGAFSGATDNTGSGTDLIIDTLPSYYTVVYIMKVA